MIEVHVGHHERRAQDRQPAAATLGQVGVVARQQAGQIGQGVRVGLLGAEHGRRELADQRGQRLAPDRPRMIIEGSARAQVVADDGERLHPDNSSVVR
jgi:hypothetical protein